MHVVNITDEDIEKVEEKFGLTFDEKSKEFIKCLISKDIQACPGAGKTTSLVAKLDIFSNFMPFSDNSGVLVLTHTNVAVDEIKKKLGANAQKVLGYPNHVGTFQSFVNKYLAIPMYVKLFSKKPERIDSNIFDDKLLKRLKLYYLDNFIPMVSEANKLSNIEYFLKSLIIEEDRIVLLQKGNRKKTIVKKGKISYKNIKRALENDIINEVVSEGYLTYEHCYELALKYLEDYPQIIEIFKKRFKYVFVDEAQDTDDRQFEILNKIFDDNSIIQCIGDNNQAIFNFSGKKDNGWQVGEHYIEIKDTKRLSKQIAKQVVKVALNPQELNGIDTIDILPTIIIFENIEQVIPKFADLIVEHNLYTKDNAIFKVVGGVGKINDNGDTIVDYYPGYTQNDNNSLDYDNLLEKLENFVVENIQPKDYRNIILDIVKDYLKNKNIKNIDKFFTNNTIVSTIKENDEDLYTSFKLLLLQITDKLASSECVIDEIRTLLQMFLDLYGNIIDDDILNNVIKNYKINFEKKAQHNIYKYDNDGINFDIHISTIHKVKGETHIATLVLETFNRGYDLFHLLKLLQGRKFSAANVDKKKLMYVAMSRATDFLCLAMHHNQKSKEITAKDIEILENNGFRVIYEPL